MTPQLDFKIHFRIFGPPGIAKFQFLAKKMDGRILLVLSNRQSRDWRSGNRRLVHPLFLLLARPVLESFLVKMKSQVRCLKKWTLENRRKYENAIPRTAPAESCLLLKTVVRPLCYLACVFPVKHNSNKTLGLIV